MHLEADMWPVIIVTGVLQISHNHRNMQPNAENNNTVFYHTIMSEFTRACISNVFKQNIHNKTQQQYLIYLHINYCVITEIYCGKIFSGLLTCKGHTKVSYAHFGIRVLWNCPLNIYINISRNPGCVCGLILSADESAEMTIWLIEPSGECDWTKRSKTWS